MTTTVIRTRVSVDTQAQRALSHRDENVDAEFMVSRKLIHRLVECARHYFDLGATSFGGPGVHVVILRRRFVEKLQWVDDTTFADLFALGNALPGPGSTQLAFSIAVVRGGTLCGILAFLLWSIPGAVGMIGLALGVGRFQSDLPAIILALLTGFNAAAVGLIALAAYQLAQSAITDHLTRLIVISSASLGVCYHAPWMYPTLIVVGGLTTLAVDLGPKMVEKLRSSGNRSLPSVQAEGISLEDVERSSSRTSSVRQRRSNADAVPQARIDDNVNVNRSASRHLRVPSRRTATFCAASLAAIYVVAFVVRSRISPAPRLLELMCNMLIAGVIIFGGGPVVVPLLRGYTVDNGWVSSRDFLLGFAILQAFPGPNFNFAAYLGVLAVPHHPILGALLAWLGIFSPGLLLKLALLPVYNVWRRVEIVKSILRGLNASAVGLVFTAVWQLFLVGYIYQPASGTPIDEKEAMTSASAPLTSDPWWGVVATWAFVLTQWFRLPAAITVLLGGLAGLAWFAVVGSSGTTQRGG